MKAGRFKFPRTPHLAWLGEGLPRDDKLLGPREAMELLSSPVVIEEKVDGANIGIAFDSFGSPRIQNRGTILSFGAHPQFQPLWPWLAGHRAKLATALEDRLILFGEWCFAVHSVRYQRLPDWFLPFDVYEMSAGKFWSSGRRDSLVCSLGLHSVPVLGSGLYTLAALRLLLQNTRSKYANAPIEGLYIRAEKGGWLVKRAKLVRPEFVHSIDQHWTARSLVQNSLSGATP